MQRIKGIRQYLADSYNGLVKVTLLPHLPSRRSLFILLLGLGFGLIWAYGVSPVQFYGADPSQLSDGWRSEWVKLVAGSQEGLLYPDEDITRLLQQVDQPGRTVETLTANTSGTLQARLQNIQSLADNAGAGKAAPQPGSLVNDIIGFVIPIVLVIIVVPLLAVVWGVLLSGPVLGIWDRLTPKSEEEKQERAVARAALDARRAAAEAQKHMHVEADIELGEPMIQRLSVYTKGRQFDDSFAIEDADDMFLGECGAAVSKSIGASGDLSAVEIWLFDKEDFVRTLTKVFASEHAFNDPAIRAELEPKVENPATDIVLAQPGAELVLETNALRVRAKISEMTYGTGALPPNSHFDGLQIELAAWQKDTIGATVPTASAVPVTAPPMGGVQPLSPPPLQPAPQQPLAPPPLQPQQQPFSPPPLQPPPTSPPATPPGGRTYAPLSPPPLQQPPASPPAAPPGGGTYTPLSPPPLQPPAPMEDDDDDPFGGTGDFTPLGN